MKQVILLFGILMIGQLGFSQTEQNEKEEPIEMVELHSAEPHFEPEINDDEILCFSEEMPRFSGCEHISDKLERKQCSIEKMLNFIADHIYYSELAQQNSVEGIVVVRFVVEKDGTLSSFEVIKDIGGGCGAVALEIVKKMPDWIAGKHRGKPMKVRIKVPVKFKL